MFIIDHAKAQPETRSSENQWLEDELSFEMALKKGTFLSFRGCTGSGVDPQLWHQFLSSQLYFQRYQPNITHCCCFTLQVTRSHEELQVVGWMF